MVKLRLIHFAFFCLAVAAAFSMAAIISAFSNGRKRCNLRELSMFYPSQIMTDWQENADGSLTFHHSFCSNFRRFSADDLRQCLRDKHIIFVGDSLARYQYLSFAYWLEKRRPPPPSSTDTEPSVCEEFSWGEEDGRWQRFMEGTSLLLKHERCDCFRMDVPAYRMDHERTVENRYYHLEAQSIRVSFIQLFGQHEMHGHNREGLTCKAGDCDPARFPLDWRGDLPTVLASVVKPMRPTHLIVNTGMWWEPKLENSADMDWLQRVATAGLDAVAPMGGQVIWRTTTSERQGLFIFDRAAVQVMEAAGWLIFDTGLLTYGLAGKFTQWWNKKHFRCAGFNELNQLLANLVCPDQLP